MSMKYVQPGVYFAESQKLMYTMSPMKRAYKNDAGLTYSLLIENNRTKKEKILTIYRNLKRMNRYLQLHKFPKNILSDLFIIKLRQDYNYRRSVILNEANLKSLTDDEIFKRLINTVNFVHNATLDSLENRTARPTSFEFKILSSIVQYEMSRSVNGNKLKNQFFNNKKFQQFREIERSWNLNNFESLDQTFKEIQLWWIDHKTGLYQNSVCFDYIKELNEKRLNNDFLNNMIISNLNFEKSLILFNEETNIIL